MVYGQIDVEEAAPAKIVIANGNAVTLSHPPAAGTS
jgi:hypothetical protein